MLLMLGVLGEANLAAQIPRDQIGVQQLPSKTPRAAAPKDYTGYWVSVVTELWRYRMMVPDKNDFQFVPLNPEGRKVADTWDPAKDQAAGAACKSYAAPAIMQVPGRIHVYWQDDNTLRIDTDSGTQTRLFHFGGAAPESEAPSWQGYSAASWEGQEFVDTRDGQGGPVLDSKGNLLPEGIEGQRIFSEWLPARCVPATCKRMEFHTAPTRSWRSSTTRLRILTRITPG